jgi:hypothetical protein
LRIHREAAQLRGFNILGKKVKYNVIAVGFGLFIAVLWPLSR